MYKPEYIKFCEVLKESIEKVSEEYTMGFFQLFCRESWKEFFKANLEHQGKYERDCYEEYLNWLQGIGNDVEWVLKIIGSKKNYLRDANYYR